MITPEQIKLFEEKAGSIQSDPTSYIFMVSPHHPAKIPELVGYIIEEIDDEEFSINILGNFCSPVMVLDEECFHALINQHWKCWGQ